MKHLIICTFLTLLAISCNKEETSSIITQENLIGCWIHNSEAQTTDGSTTYLMTKCEVKDFPASWFRYSIIFEEDNKGSELLLAANDAHSHHDMNWRLTDQNLTINGLFEEVEYSVEVVDEVSIVLIRN